MTAARQRLPGGLAVVLARRRLLAVGSLLTCVGATRSWGLDPAVSLPPIYSIAADDDGLYGSAGSFPQHILWRLAHGQPEPAVLARTSDRIFRNVMPYGPDLYFTSDDQVMRVPKAGGTTEQVAEHPGGNPVFDMVRDETDLYVSIQDTRRPMAGGVPNPHPGGLLRMRLPRGKLVPLA